MEILHKVGGIELDSSIEEERHYEVRMPRWLHRPIRVGRDLAEVREILHEFKLNTVCASAKCPNHMECFSRRTATFMLLGDTCTRNCAFCGVAKGDPRPVDDGEAERLALAAAAMGLRHVVMTSVTRDDLPDGGAAQFAAAIIAVRERLPQATIEVLTPDFKGDLGALRIVLEAGPEVFNHNLETVEELYPLVRPAADYRRSLNILKTARIMVPGIKIKSGLMVGLGETRSQLKRAFADLADAGCDILTVGQYLRPSLQQVRVSRFISPEEFVDLGAEAEKAGIPVVAAAPFVRSSYRAKELLDGKEKTVDRMVDHRVN
jgi:lipoic acid synthetase